MPLRARRKSGFAESIWKKMRARTCMILRPDGRWWTSIEPAFRFSRSSVSQTWVALENSLGGGPEEAEATEAVERGRSRLSLLPRAGPTAAARSRRFDSANLRDPSRAAEGQAVAISGAVWTACLRCEDPLRRSRARGLLRAVRPRLQGVQEALELVFGRVAAVVQGRRRARLDFEIHAESVHFLAEFSRSRRDFDQQRQRRLRRDVSNWKGPSRDHLRERAGPGQRHSSTRNGGG